MQTAADANLSKVVAAEETEVTEKVSRFTPDPTRTVWNANAQKNEDLDVKMTSYLYFLVILIHLLKPQTKQKHTATTRTEQNAMIVVVSRQRRHFSLSRCLRFGITSLLSSYRSYIVGLITTVSCCVLSSMAMSLSSASFPTKSPRTLVVIGGGIQGASVAYYLAQQQHQQGSKDNIIILESKMPASAASGKGGGFMARSWGDGSPTQRLHEIAFDLFDMELSTQLPLTSYRKLPVLSVTPGTKPAIQQAKSAAVSSILPNWLNGKVGGISVLGSGHDTAQVTPAEVVEKMLEAVADRVQVVLGTCTGITSEVIDDTTSTTPQERRITGVTYLPRSNNDDDTSSSVTPLTLAADVVCISAGPWSCAAEAWLDGAVQLPMEGIKSTSIVWRPPQDNPNAVVDATALFCGEDHRYGTHCT